MNDSAFTPSRIIDALEVLLAQLEASLAPEVNEGDTRSDFLKKRLSSYKDQTARLRTVLSKHQAAQRRRKVIDRENKRRR